MYEGNIASDSLVGEISSEFSVTLGLHTKSTSSFFIFILVMDELIRELHDEITWCVLFVDDIVLVDKAI